MFSFYFFDKPREVFEKICEKANALLSNDDRSKQAMAIKLFIDSMLAHPVLSKVIMSKNELNGDDIATALGQYKNGAQAIGALVFAMSDKYFCLANILLCENDQQLREGMAGYYYDTEIDLARAADSKKCSSKTI